MSSIGYRRAAQHLARIAAAIALAACSSVTLAPNRIRVHRGPAFGQVVRRVVALPATCGTLGEHWTAPGSLEAPPAAVDPATPPPVASCPADRLGGIDSRIRALLEFQGQNVIDSETLNARTRTRRELEVRNRGTGMPERIDREVDLDGARFADATLTMQREILAEIGADAVLNTRILIGAAEGLSGRRLVEVQIRLMAVPSGQLVWARRCEVEAGGLLTSDMEAADTGASCAIGGGTGAP